MQNVKLKIDSFNKLKHNLQMNKIGLILLLSVCCFSYQQRFPLSYNYYDLNNSVNFLPPGYPPVLESSVRTKQKGLNKNAN